MSEYILLRNTVSGVTSPFSRAHAQRVLSIPKFAEILVEVDSEKPEVLSEPYRIDEEGQREKIADTETEEEE